MEVSNDPIASRRIGGGLVATKADSTGDGGIGSSGPGLHCWFGVHTRQRAWPIRFRVPQFIWCVGVPPPPRRTHLPQNPVTIAWDNRGLGSGRSRPSRFGGPRLAFRVGGHMPRTRTVTASSGSGLGTGRPGFSPGRPHVPVEALLDDGRSPLLRSAARPPATYPQSVTATVCSPAAPESRAAAAISARGALWRPGQGATTGCHPCSYQTTAHAPRAMSGSAPSRTLPSVKKSPGRDATSGTRWPHGKHVSGHPWLASVFASVRREWVDHRVHRRARSGNMCARRYCLGPATIPMADFGRCCCGFGARHPLPCSAPGWGRSAFFKHVGGLASRSLRGRSQTLRRRHRPPGWPHHTARFNDCFVPRSGAGGL